MKSVLVVDDAQFMRLSLKMMLEENGFKVIGEAVDGIDALNKYKVLNPDIVSMDITMPRADGLDGLKLIREYDEKATVVMVTAVGQESIVRKCIINGAKGFVVKPFKENILVKQFSKV